MKFILYFLLSFALIFALMFWVLSVHMERSLPPRLTGDGPDYEQLAYNLSVGKGFSYHWSGTGWRPLYGFSMLPEWQALQSRSGELMPVTGRPPLLPALLALIYCILPRGPEAMFAFRVGQFWLYALASAMAAALTALIVQRQMTSAVDRERRFEYPSRASWVVWPACSALVVCIFAIANNTAREYCFDLLTEPLSMMLVQLWIVVWVTGDQRSGNRRLGWLRILVLGLIAGLMFLARSIFIMWIPILIWLCLPPAERSNRTWAQYSSSSTRPVALFMVGFLLLAGPWMARNCYVLGRFMPMGTQGPITLLGGYCNEAIRNGGNWSSAPERQLRARVLNAMQETSVEQEIKLAEMARQEVRDWIAKNWQKLPRLFAMRIESHWGPYFGTALFFRMCALGGAIWLILSRRWEAWALVGIPIYNTLVCMLLYEVGGRFLVPLYPCLYMLAAFPIVAALRMLAGHGNNRRERERQSTQPSPLTGTA